MTSVLTHNAPIIFFLICIQIANIQVLQIVIEDSSCDKENCQEVELAECPMKGRSVKLKPLEDGEHWIDREKVIFVESSGRDHLNPR